MTLKPTTEMTPSGGIYLQRFISQLQSLTVWIGAGAAANTNIPITGLKATATLLAALKVMPPATGSGTTFDDVKDEAVITAGNIKFTSTATNGTSEQVLLIYFNND